MMELCENRDQWFRNSRLVDETGAPLVMYHGTPDASFGRFRDDQFFTPDIGYARRFLSSATSSSSFYGVTDRRPGVFSVLIRAENPFDTRNPAHRALLRERFCGVHGEGALTDLGLPDWVEGRDIALWLREEHADQGFDAVLVDEGRDEAGQRPPSWIVFSGDQVRVIGLLEHGSDEPEPDEACEP
ncbi:MAG: hypothetical protein KC466_14365 [Myxococcales bacterium]|nr:hypothetical protein [Myxococcales bacterium]